MALEPLRCKAFVVLPGGQIEAECELHADHDDRPHQAVIGDARAFDKRARTTAVTITWESR